MLRILTTILFLLFYLFFNAQTIDFYPSHKNGIPKEDYEKGKYFLENTYKQMKENGNVCYADYWNIALAYAYMGQSPDTILDLLKKSKSDHPENFCTVANWSQKDKPIEEYMFYKVLKKKYVDLISDCDGQESNEELKLKDPSFYKGYNYELIKKLNELKDKDQKYRGQANFLQSPELIENQRLLDIQNENEIYRIIKKYGYPGASIVSEEWRDIACVILVHANSLTIQEELLPVIAKAAGQGELGKGIVRILVDKIQLKKTGKQIFGSQVGIPFEAESKIRALEKKYNL